MQKEFAQRILDVSQLTRFNLEHLAELDALFASLQHRALRGELTQEHMAAAVAMAG
jgi:type I restriction enzyme S subunit